MLLDEFDPKTMVVRYTFPKKVRLRRSFEFSAVLSARVKFRGDFFIINEWTPDVFSIEKQAFPRLGLVISKRFARNSVIRNTLKRIVRESFRVQKHMIPENDYVVRLCKRIFPQSLKSLKRVVRKEIDAHFQNIMSR